MLWCTWVLHLTKRYCHKSFPISGRSGQAGRSSFIFLAKDSLHLNSFYGFWGDLNLLALKICLPCSYVSVSDIISDVLLFVNYLDEESFLNVVQFQNDSSVSNITGSRTCTMVEEVEAGFLFSCQRPVLTGLTLALIYLPGVNVIGTLLGPRTAGKCCHG